MANTSLGIFYPLATDYVKSSTAEALQDHLMKMASTTNAAILAEIGKVKEIIELTGGEDLNDFRTTGRYILRLASTAGPIANLPPWITSQNVFLLDVTAHTVGSFQYVMQDFSGISDNSSGVSSGYYRRNTSGASGALWIPWRRLDNDVAVANGGAGNANRLRVQEFKDAFGTISTGGKAAVALRFDHGLANFNTKIRPLLEARNLPYCLALSSRHWDASENAGVTPAMVDSWTLAEVWNHGAGNHQDANDLAGLTDMIVTGKSELEAQLPNKTIWGFIPAGVGGTNYGGFNGGDSPEAFYGTLAGQLILENHAVSSGAYPGTSYRPLDGEVRQGMSHAGLETRTVSSLQSLVNTAIAGKTGLQLMTHPSRLDESGYHTTAQLTQMLDYIVAKRDAGELVVLSPYEMMVADARQTITVKETAGRTVSVWDYLNNREQIIYGDTGIRDITALAPNVTSGKLYLYRDGNTVTLIFDVVQMAGATGSSYDMIPSGGIPTGFRPTRTFWFHGLDGPPSNRRIGVSSAGWVPVYLAPVPGDTYRGTISWRTAQPWPTVLPGVAA